MSENLREELKAEYAILQTQYEAFDARALQIKSWSAPLIAGGIGLGAKDSSWLIFASVVGALCLWLLEAIWKSFQYCYTDRIKLIESWFRGELQDGIAPFQIFAAWGELWHRYYTHPKTLFPILCQRFVFMPYLPLAIFGLVLIAVRGLSFQNRCVCD